MISAGHLIVIIPVSAFAGLWIAAIIVAVSDRK